MSVGRGREGRGEQVDAGAALGNMEADACLGVGVVGDLRAPGEFNGLVGFTGSDHLDAACAKEGAEANAEGEGGDLFVFAVGEFAPEVFAAVSGIEYHHEAGRLGGGRRRSGWGRLSRRGRS